MYKIIKLGSVWMCARPFACKTAFDRSTEPFASVIWTDKPDHAVLWPKEFPEKDDDEPDDGDDELWD